MRNGCLCLEAAERPQWARLYSLGRPRPCDRMPGPSRCPWPGALSAGLGFN